VETIQNPIAGVIYHSDEQAQHWLEKGAWVPSTLGNALRATAKRLPEKAAFVLNDQTLTFAELDGQFSSWVPR